MIRVLAVTMAAIWPPEPDTVIVCLVRDGWIETCVTEEQTQRCAVFDVPTPMLGSSYSSVSYDWSWNESGLGNVLGGDDIWDVVRRRRDLAGMDP